MFVLVEAISKCVCAEEKELCRIGEVALQVVLETATTLMGGVDKVSICVHANCSVVDVWYHFLSLYNACVYTACTH